MLMDSISWGATARIRRAAPTPIGRPAYRLCANGPWKVIRYGSWSRY
jgi:hypothetical protein